MLKQLLAVFCLVGVAGVGFTPTDVYARPFTGRAAIENGNIEKARLAARREAMREFVESEVGTYINSQTEMVNYMVVRDRVVSNSDGYVLVKKVISEKSLGDIYEITLDLEAGKTPVTMAIEDVKNQLHAMSEDSSRSGVDIAIYDDDAHKTSHWANYLAETLNMGGYRAEVNDAINAFLGDNINKMNDLQLNPKLRQMGRAERMGNSLVRGRVGLAKKATPVQGGGYKAIAKFTAQIIGYESNHVDAVSRFATAFDSEPGEAERLAKEMVVREAVDILSNQTATTIQREQGRGTVKTTLIFTGFANKGAESQKVLKILNQSSIRVVRNAFAGNGFRVFVTYTGASNGSEVADIVIEKLHAAGYTQAYKEEAPGQGAIKYIVRLRG